MVDEIVSQKHTGQQTLAEARKAARLTQAELAHRSGVAASTIVAIETGRVSRPFKTRYDVAAMLAASLDLEVGDILWPRGLSNRGRPAGTGDSRTAVSRKSPTAVCSSCCMALPATGICDDCDS